MSGRSFSFLGFLVTVVALACSAHGQGGATGAIAGAVLDSKGAPISKAQVEIREGESSTTVRTVFADASGNFTVASLPVDAYDVVVSATGFSTSKYNSVIVRVTETTRLNPSLSSLQSQASAEAARAGQEMEVMVVSAPPVVTVETSSAATGRIVEAEVIRSLPLATQNFHQLLNLSAGALSNLNASAALGRGDVGINVNGQRQNNNNYMLDGISVPDLRNSELLNTPLPRPDAAQEFKVQTSLYDATERRNGGGNVNAVLKSGTSQWHGSAFEFFRNSILNANEFFQKAEGEPRPVVRQNLFGSSLGGPLGHAARGGFLFLSYQGTRQASGLSPGAIISAVIPALPIDRSEASLSMAGFGNTTTAIDPVVLKLLNVKNDQFGSAYGGWLIPSRPPSDPANPSAGAEFNLSRPGRFNEDQATANYDRQFKDGRDKIAGLFFFSNFHSYLPFGTGSLPSTPGESLNSGDLNFPVDLPVRNRFLSLAETHVLGPRVVNELRFGFLDLRSQISNRDPVTADQLGIVRPSNNVTEDIYRFEVSGLGIGPNETASLSQAQYNYTWADTL